MEAVTFGRWRLMVDPDATRLAYARLDQRWPRSAGCDCSGCLNFRAQLDGVYPAAVRALFTRVGVQPGDEIELAEYGPLDSERHKYAGWFHIVGKVESGRDVHHDDIPGQPTGFDVEQVADHFWLGFSEWTALVQMPFKGVPLLQFDFAADVPWILNEPPHYS